jgi:Adenylosuccinate lyase (EC 4.3.2.2)
MRPGGAGEPRQGYKGLVAVGRTHGQWAEPITLGFKFANYYYELHLACRHLALAEDMVRAKIGGAVGTMAAGASWGPRSGDESPRSSACPSM